VGTIRVSGHTWEELYDQCEQFSALVEHTLAAVIDRAIGRVTVALTAAGPDVGGIASDWSDQVDQILGPYLGATFDSGALAAAYDAVNQLPVPDGYGIPQVSNQATQEYLAGAKINLKNVGSELEQQIRETIQSGIDDGLSVDELAANIRSVSDFTHSRANTIARTEVVRASNAGSFTQALLLTESGDLKEWVATEDSRTREDHVHADGQRVPVNAMFSVGGWAMAYPGDDTAPAGETVNCRCTVTYVFDGDQPPANICQCSDAITASTTPGINVHTSVVTPDVCVAPSSGTMSLHEATMSSLPAGAALDDVMKQQIFDEFKGQGPISPAYGGAKIYKHLTSMSASWLDDYQKLAIIDEVYVKQGGKSSFLDKFDEWVHTTAGKKATGGTVKPPPLKSKPPAPHVVPTVKPAPVVTPSPPTPPATKLVHATNADKTTPPTGVYGAPASTDEVFSLTAMHPTGTIIGEANDNGLELRAIVHANGGVEVERWNWSKKQWTWDGMAQDSGEFAEYWPNITWHKPASMSATPTPSVSKPTSHVVTPPVKPPVVAADPLDISHVTQSQIDTLYDAFKSIKPVTPGWGGSAIYKTLQQVKQSPAVINELIGLNDAQLLKMLDEKFSQVGKAGAKTYLDETSKWLNSPAGKNYVAKNAITPTVPSGTTPPKPAVKPHVGPVGSKTTGPVGAPSTGMGGDISNVPAIIQSTFFNAYKKKNIYLSSPPSVMWDGIIDLQAKSSGADKYTPLQLIRMIDTQGAAKLGVTNTNLYEKKLVDWFKTSEGSDALKVYNMSPEEKLAHAAKLKAEQEKKAAAAAAKAAADAAAAAIKFKSLTDVQNTVPAFNANHSKFSEISISDAQLHQDKLEPWTSAQRSALRYYTSNNYTAMNGALRRGITPSPDLMKRITDAQAGMRPSVTPMLLHRGTGFKSFGVNDITALKQLIGKTVLEPGFTSSSAGHAAAFSGQVKMEIEAPVGTPMAFVKSISHFNHENEMLLAAMTKFKILSVTERTNSYGSSTAVVRVRVVP